MTCEATVNLRQWFPTSGVSQFPYKFAVNNGFSTKKKCPTLKLLLVILKDLGILRDLKLMNVYTFCCCCCFLTLQQVFIFTLFLLQCLKPKEINFFFQFGCVYKFICLDSAQSMLWFLGLCLL